MQLVCPECKNAVDLTSYPTLAPDQVVECNMCGINLLVKSVDGDDVVAEVDQQEK
jgi:DNA-directed RNA polymerase subunit RPC12/RpoP